MSKYIALFDLSRNEVGKLEIENGETFAIHVAANYTYLENALKAIGEKLKGKDALTLKKSFHNDGAIVESSETIAIGDERYIDALASFINKSIRTTPRIIAVVKTLKEV